MVRYNLFAVSRKDLICDSGGIGNHTRLAQPAQTAYAATNTKKAVSESQYIISSAPERMSPASNKPNNIQPGAEEPPQEEAVAPTPQDPEPQKSVNLRLFNSNLLCNTTILNPDWNSLVLATVRGTEAHAALVVHGIEPESE